MTSTPDLESELEQASRAYEEFASRGLALDITRGKPGSEQLDLSDALLGLVTGRMRARRAGSTPATTAASTALSNSGRSSPPCSRCPPTSCWPAAMRP